MATINFARLPRLPQTYLLIMTAILHTPHHGVTSYPVAYLQYGFFWLTVQGRETPFNACEIKEIKHI